MASASNENGNLMDEFEEAFQACLLSLTKPEPNVGTNKEEIELEVQKTTNRFIDVARQMEAFFLQKRFLVSTLKQEMLIKEENQDLRYEIQRKEYLLNKHYNRLEEWKACLADIQQNQGVLNRPLPAGVAGGPQMGGMVENPALLGMPPGAGMPMTPGQQQHLSALQQQKLLQAQQLQMRMMSNKMPK